MKSVLSLSVVGVDDVFFSMADMDMSHSLSSLPPLGEPPTVDLDLSLNSNYSASPGESPSGNATVRLQLFDCSHNDILKSNVGECSGSQGLVNLLDPEILSKLQYNVNYSK